MDTEKPSSTGVPRHAWADGELSCRFVRLVRLGEDGILTRGNEPCALIGISFLVMHKEWCQNTLSRLTFCDDTKNRSNRCSYRA
jgi:hypothetical protein